MHTCVLGCRTRATALLMVPLLALTAHSIALALAAPDFEPQKWNIAWKLSVANITDSQQMELDIVLSSGWGDICTGDGYDTPARKAPLNSCYRQRSADGMWTYWLKRPGDWRTNSNSYCYALNLYKGGPCMPGQGSSSRSPLFAQWITCDLLRDAVITDGARQVTRAQALQGQPETGHYIALKVRNDSCTPYRCWLNNYQALRKDHNSFWSWKQPRGPARDLDLVGLKITDPETAIVPGHYDIFCGYYHVVPEMMTIRVDFDDNPYLKRSLADYARFYEAGWPGINVTLDPIRYNNLTDDAFDIFSQSVIDMDLQWESKRGTSEWLAFEAEQRQQQLEQQPQPPPDLVPSAAAAAGSPAQAGSGASSSKTALPVISNDVGTVLSAPPEGISVGSGSGSSSSGSSSSSSVGTSSIVGISGGPPDPHLRYNGSSSSSSSSVVGTSGGPPDPRLPHGRG